jgi:protein tyrosine/serine phosphatase
MIVEQRPRMKSFRALLIGVLLIIAVYGGYLLLTGNVHTITEGEAYRSAQLDRSQLTRHIKQYNIKSIINLRGENKGDEWYDDEIAVSKEFGVAHYNAGLSANHEPNEEQLRELLRVFSVAPRPVLIHCAYGADRSGLAAAMWKMIVDHASKAEAKKQITILYGHIPIGSTRAMDDFFERWSAKMTETPPIPSSASVPAPAPHVGC